MWLRTDSKRRRFVKTVMNLQVPLKMGNVFISKSTISFSKMPLFHGIV